MINFKTTQCADICNANRELDVNAGEWNCKKDCPLRLLLEKQTPKKVNIHGLNQCYCPSCGNGNQTGEYCQNCGQHLKD